MMVIMMMTGQRTPTRCQPGCRQSSSSGCPGCCICPGIVSRYCVDMYRYCVDSEQILCRQYVEYYPGFQQYFTSATSSRRKYFILKDVRNQQIYRIKVPDIYLRDSIRNNAFTKNNLLVQAWRENNAQDNHDGKQDEGA